MLFILQAPPAGLAVFIQGIFQKHGFVTGMVVLLICAAIWWIYQGIKENE